MEIEEFQLFCLNGREDRRIGGNDFDLSIDEDNGEAIGDDDDEEFNIEGDIVRGREREQRKKIKKEKKNSAFFFDRLLQMFQYSMVNKGIGKVPVNNSIQKISSKVTESHLSFVDKIKIKNRKKFKKIENILNSSERKGNYSNYSTLVSNRSLYTPSPYSQAQNNPNHNNNTPKNQSGQQYFKRQYKRLKQKHNSLKKGRNHKSGMLEDKSSSIGSEKQTINLSNIFENMKSPFNNSQILNSSTYSTHNKMFEYLEHVNEYQSLIIRGDGRKKKSPSTTSRRKRRQGLKSINHIIKLSGEKDSSTIGHEQYIERNNMKCRRQLRLKIDID